MSALQYTPEQYLLRKRAYAAVAKAMRTGEIVRQACERCGAAFGEGHHADYARPLDLTWLCGVCHYEEHKRLRAEREHAKYLIWRAEWDAAHPKKGANDGA